MHINRHELNSCGDLMVAKKGKKGKAEASGINRVEEAEGKVDLYKEELKESLVEAETASSGFTEERDADERLASLDEVVKKKKGKK